MITSSHTNDYYRKVIEYLLPEILIRCSNVETRTIIHSIKTLQQSSPNLKYVWNQFVIWMLGDKEYGMINFVTKREIKKNIQNVIKMYKNSDKYILRDYATLYKKFDYIEYERGTLSNFYAIHCSMFCLYISMASSVINEKIAIEIDGLRVKENAYVGSSVVYEYASKNYVYERLIATSLDHLSISYMYSIASLNKILELLHNSHTYKK